MKPSCTHERHATIKAAPRRRWLAETVGLPHYGGRRVVVEDEGERLEYAKCAACDQTLARPVRRRALALGLSGAGRDRGRAAPLLQSPSLSLISSSLLSPKNSPLNMRE